MDMSYISLIGIIFGVALFIYMSVKGFQIVISACTASLVIILTSGNPILEMVTDKWAVGFAGFLKSFFLVLTFSSVIGKLMNDAGAAKRIAKALYGLCSKAKSNQKFVASLFVPLMYVILTFAGISGLVVVFTVLGIGMQIMRDFDIPWRLYCYGGATSVCTAWMPGSLNLTNIAATTTAGVPLTASPVLGIVTTAVYLIVAVIFLYFDLKAAEKNNEGFMETGKDFLESAMAKGKSEEGKMPSLLVSVLPLLVAIIAAAAFKIDIIIALFIGLVLAVVLFWRYLPSVKGTLGDGVQSAFGPVVGVAATSAVASVIMAAPGFAIIVKGLSSLPLILEGIGYVTIITFITASPSGAVASMGAKSIECFTAAGLSMNTAARMTALSAFTSVPPHSAAIANVTAVAKLDYKRAVGIYLKVGMIGGFCALVVGTLMVQFGLVS